MVIRHYSSFAPVDDPRRLMFAGGRLTFDGEVPIDTRLTRHSEVASTSTNEGRTGQLMFVEIKHRVSADEGRIISEFQNVFLPKWRNVGNMPDRRHSLVRTRPRLHYRHM